MPARKPKEPEQPKQEQQAAPQRLGTPSPGKRRAPKITRYPNGTERRDN